MVDDAGAAAPPLQRAGLSGLDYVRATMDGRIAQSAMAKTIGWKLAKVELGKVTFTVKPGPHLWGNNTLHGGAISALLDGATAAALNSALPADKRCRTLDFSVTFLGAITDPEVELTAEAEVVQLRRNVALVEARLLDQKGALQAKASATFTVQTIALP
jgi:uncharacterized protein (TIGR00369 family)